MFEAHREKKATEEYQAALAHWQQQHDGYVELLRLAQAFNGARSDDLLLGKGEALFYKVTNAALVEDRRGPGHYQGGSTGVSVPIGSLGGHSVRYRVGASRGHYVQGTPTPTAIDTGTVYVTNQRLVFQGAKQTRECLFTKLIAVHHDDAGGSTTLSVSNRQKPTTVHYGPALSANFDFRLELALAHFRGTVPNLVAQLRQDLAQIQAARPVAPAPRAQ